MLLERILREALMLLLYRFRIRGAVMEKMSEESNLYPRDLYVGDLRIDKRI